MHCIKKNFFKKRTGEELWRLPRNVCGFGTSVRDLCPWLACCCLKTSLQHSGYTKASAETFVNTFNKLLTINSMLLQLISLWSACWISCTLAMVILHKTWEGSLVYCNKIGPYVKEREVTAWHCFAIVARGTFTRLNFEKVKKMTFITCQTINLWKSEGIVKLFCTERQK